MIKQIKLNHGEKLNLKCSIDANPSCYQVRWFHDNKYLITQSCAVENLAEYTIEHVNRSHAGRYVCEVRNWLNTSLDQQYDGISHLSTDIRVQCKI